MSDTPQGPMRLKMEQYCLNNCLADRIAHLNESESRQCCDIEEALDLATEGNDHWASNDAQQVSDNNKKKDKNFKPRCTKRARLDVTEGLQQEEDLSSDEFMPTDSRTSMSRSTRTNKRKRDKRKKEREGHTVKDISLEHVERAKQNIFFSATDISVLRRASTGWTGLPSKPESLLPKTPEMVELDKKGLQGIYWDGRTPGYIVDKNNQTVTILAGRPAGRKEGDAPDNWEVLTKATARTLEDAAERTIASESHRRGQFKSLASGISFGRGQVKPAYLDTHPNQRLVKTLLEDENIKKCVGFAAKSFQAHNEPAHRLYKNTLEYVCNKRGLRPNFPNSPWAATSFNLGANVVTIPHLDCANLAFGWCSVTAFGDFDPDTGGHMVLWDLGVYIRFPPGSTIMIPSALITHSNLAIKPGEKRSSITHYTAGSLFRWRHRDGRTDKQFEKKSSKADRLQKERDNESRWDHEALKYFPKA